MTWRRIWAYNEPTMNLSHKLNRNGMSHMFNGGECKVRSVAAHNVHEKGGGRTQEGGTSLLLFGELIQQYDLKHQERNSQGWKDGSLWC